jgi:hypothetical protein
MRRASRLATAALVTGAALATACAGGSGPIRAPSPGAAMIYGSLELPDAVADRIQWLHIYKVGEVYVPPFKTPIRARVFPNGDFYMENVSAGRYFVHHVAAGFEAFYLYPAKLAEAKDAVLGQAVDVGPGSLAYLGRYRIHDWKPGAQSRLSPQLGSVRLLSSPPESGPEPIPNFMGEKSAWTAAAGTFAMERTQPASDERRVLEHIHAEVAGTGWDEKIDGRLAALR